MAIPSKKLQNLEKRFGMIQTVVEEMSGDIEELHIAEIEKQGDNLPVKVEEVEIFSLDLLKQDFMMVRQNIIKVITAGQNILSKAALLDLGEMKPTQLDALSNLQGVLGTNMKLLIELYRQIVEIEEKRKKIKSGTEQGSPTVINGNQVNQQVFIGGTHDILKLLDSRNPQRNEDFEIEEYQIG